MRPLKVGTRVRIKREDQLRAIFTLELPVKPGVTDLVDANGIVLTEGMMALNSKEDFIKEALGGYRYILEHTPGYTWNGNMIEDINHIKYMKLKKLFELDDAARAARQQETLKKEA